MRSLGLENLRITIVLGSLDLGGAERYALTLAKYFKHEQRANVTVLGLNNIVGLVADYCDSYEISWKALGWKFHKRNVFRTLNRIRLFSNELRATRPDVVIPYIHAPNIACALTWRLARAKLCVWNQQDAGLIHKNDFYERLAIHQTPLFISNSQTGADFLKNECAVAEHKIKIVYAGVQMDAPQTDIYTWREKLQIDDNVLVVCMVANLTNLKDHRTLLYAWEKVVNKLSTLDLSAILVLAGSHGDTFAQLNQLVLDKGLSKSVRFIGQVKDIAGLLQVTDIGVLCSYSEGLPLAVLEYMACGLPVIGTDIPGIREAVGKDNYFLLAPPGDFNQLSKLLISLILDQNKRHQIGKNNQVRIKNKFSVQNQCLNTSRLILERLNAS